jgi:3',5'-cyclic AMP phosphodiesterase CpdA
MADILQISDLHFGSPYLPKIGEALLRSIEEVQPDILAISGDFTQHGAEEEFQAAREFLQILPRVPTVVTPGNHDVPSRLWLRDLFDPLRLYKEYIHPELNYTLRHEDAVIVSLNSNSNFGSWFNGSLSEKDLDYCETIFAGLPEDMLRVVMCHHHLAPAPKLNGGGVMRNAKRAIEFFSEHRVDLILGGHKHRSYIGNSMDFYAGTVRDHGIIIVQCGTSTSRRGRAREREKNTFNLIQSHPHSIHVHQYMYFKEVNGFEVIGKHFYPRAGAHYIRRDVEVQAFAP